MEFIILEGCRHCQPTSGTERVYEIAGIELTRQSGTKVFYPPETEFFVAATFKDIIFQGYIKDGKVRLT